MQENHRSFVAMRRLWSIVFVYVVSSLCLSAKCGFHFNFHEAASSGAQLLAGAIASAILLRCLPATRKLGLAFSAIFMYALISMASAMIALCAATIDYPFQDALLCAIDRSIGYDWQSYAAFCLRHPYFNRMACFGYESIQWQPVIIGICLAFRNQGERLVTYQIATLICLVIAIAIFAAMPVTTSWIHGGPREIAEAQHLGFAKYSNGWVGELRLLRAGGGKLVGWDINAGVIGFPSFHCAAAFLNGWAFWKDRQLRFGGVLLNCLMVASTPIFGGHYVADLIAGFLVALASVKLAELSYPKLAEMEIAPLWNARVPSYRPYPLKGRVSS